jgi:hypothetical protein
MYASPKRQAVAIRQSWCDASDSGPCAEPRGLRGGVWSTPVPSPTVTPVAIADSTAFLMVSMPLAHGGSFCRLGLPPPSSGRRAPRARDLRACVCRSPWRRYPSAAAAVVELLDMSLDYSGFSGGSEPNWLGRQAQGLPSSKLCAFDFVHKILNRC